MMDFNACRARVYTEDLIRRAFLEQLRRAKTDRPKRCLTAVALVSLLAAGCRSPATYRTEADEVASDIITTKQKEALGATEPFGIERPSDILRHRLLEQQNLAYSSEASFGTGQLT
ncbi:MAG: hypothetical protein ACYTAO_15575, partial [Planctomycetota bacterium]